MTPVFLLTSSGGMYYPWTWHSTTQPKPSEGVSRFRFELKVPIPKDHCVGEACRFHMGMAEWFTNRTYRNLEIAPNPTISEKLYDQWLLKMRPHWKVFEKHPWSAPGSAKIFGSCGVNGGNPNGCGQGENIWTN